MKYPFNGSKPFLYMIQLSLLRHSKRDSSGRKMHGLRLWEKLRAFQSVWQGHAIPPKFKVSDFNKSKGTTCPKNHLKMYCRKMGAYTKDEKLLMHFFHESLTGAAVTWYTNLEPS